MKNSYRLMRLHKLNVQLTEAMCFDGILFLVVKQALLAIPKVAPQ